jgi:phage-related protein
LARAWDFYRTKDGACPVEKELEKCKLTRAEQAKLYVVMDRVQTRRTLSGDVKSLGGDLLEVRVSGDRRIFRLLYVEQSEGLLLLGLVFFQKKTQATPPAVKLKAKRRLTDWRKRVSKE